MVFWQMLAAVRRWPLVALAGLAATVFALYVVHGHPGLYSTEVSAIFLNPAPKAQAGEVAVPVNPLDGLNPELVSAAGVVAREMSSGHSMSLSGSDSLPLVGTGITHGYSVTLPNSSGSQWVIQFDRPVLDVQVVGRNPQEVQALLDAAMTKIKMTLEQREVRAGTTDDQMIRVLQNPTRPVIIEGTGDRKRAMAATLMLGILLTLTAINLLQHRSGPIERFRRRRRAGRQSQAEGAASGSDRPLTEPRVPSRAGAH